jgi:hypothetical protein
MRFLAVVAIAVAAAATLAATDLDPVRAEPNLEKRAQKALDNAEKVFKSAQDSYLVKGDLKQTGIQLDEVAESVELAYTSLLATRKNPSKSPKHFKRAEIETRSLLRRLDDFRDQMSVEDRDTTDKARALLQKVHEELLEGIMGGKKI